MSEVDAAIYFAFKILLLYLIDLGRTRARPEKHCLTHNAALPSCRVKKPQLQSFRFSFFLHIVALFVVFLGHVLARSYRSGRPAGLKLEKDVQKTYLVL